VNHVEILHHRYATALFRVARAGKKEDAVMKNLDFLASLVESNKRVAKFLYNPGIRDEIKIKFLLSIAAKKKFCEEFVDFLKLLVKKRRIRLLHGVLLRYMDFYHMYKNRLVVLLKSAYKLESSQLKSLKKALAKRFGKEILIEQAVEPSLMGGLLIQVGDKIYDTTLRTGLVKLREVIA